MYHLGYAAVTVPVLIALCYRSVRKRIKSLTLDKGLPLMSWTVGLTIFIFYCIPASKRSVYLLPCYPFLAYGVTWVLMEVKATRLMQVWSIILSVLAIAAPLVFITGSLGCIPKFVTSPLHWWLWPVAAAPAVVGIWWLHTRSQRGMTLGGVLWITYVMLIAYNGAYMPMTLNARSDVRAAQTIADKVPADAKIVSVIDDSLMRYYSINFYLNDRIRRVPDVADVPADAWLITTPADNIAGDTITTKSCDTRRPVILVPPRTAPVNSTVVK